LETSITTIIIMVMAMAMVEEMGVVTLFPLLLF
jgi:hypothetical protein